MMHTRAHEDLRNAFAREGCPVCRLTLAGVQHSIESLDYDAVNDLGFRQQTREAHGFCNLHADQWLHSAHILGTALIYEQVVIDTSGALGRMRFRKERMLARILTRLRGEAADVEALAPTGTCPICILSAEQERALLSTLVEALNEESFRDAYVQSDGLCLPHLRRALASATDAATFAVLRDTAMSNQDRLQTHLREIIRKHDYRYRHEPSGEETGAAARAVAHVAGGRNVPESMTAPGVPYAPNARREDRKDRNNARER